MDIDNACSSSSKRNERTAAKDDPVLQRLVASQVIHGELYSSDEEFDLPFDNDELSDNLEEMFLKEQIKSAQKLFFDIIKDENTDDMDDILDEVIKCPEKMSECLAQNKNLKASDILDYLQDILETNSLMRDKLLIFEQGLLKKQQELKDALSILEQEDLDFSDDENVEEESEEVTLESPYYLPPKDGIVYVENNGFFFGQFSPPYFKTKQGFMCPLNEDAMKEKNSNRLCVTNVDYKKPWTNHSLETLENVLKKCLIEEFKNRPDFKSVYKWREYSTYVKSHTLAEVLLDREFKFDWLKVSVMLGDSENRSGSECKKIWDLYLDPRYNKNEWTEEEDKLIVFLSSFYKEFEWEQIAKEIGTGRSSFQVFVHYQNEVRKKQHKGLKWTPEEDEKIKHIVKCCTYGEFISWKKVIYYFENRSYSQVYSRYTMNLLYDKKGKFSNVEDRVLISSVFEHKLRIHDTVKILKNQRSRSQIRGRVKNVYELIKSGKNVGEFTFEEDEKLLRLVEDKGPRWTEIAKVMGSRDRTQVRHRYNKLKMKLEDPNFDLEKIDRSKKKIKTYMRKRHKKILDLIEEKESVNSKEKNKGLTKKSKFTRVDLSCYDETFDVKKSLEEYFLNNGCFKWLPEPSGPPPEDCEKFSSLFKSILEARLPTTSLDENCKNLDSITHLVGKLKDESESFNSCHASTSSCSISEPQTVTLIPPNLLTCSGFMNLLSHCTEGVKVNYVTDSTASSSPEFEEAKLLWKRRLFQLFLWPAILSNKDKKNKFATY